MRLICLCEIFFPNQSCRVTFWEPNEPFQTSLSPKLTSLSPFTTPKQASGASGGLLCWFLGRNSLIPGPTGPDKVRIGYLEDSTVVCKEKRNSIEQLDGYLVSSFWVLECFGNISATVRSDTVKLQTYRFHTYIYLVAKFEANPINIGGVINVETKWGIG